MWTDVKFNDEALIGFPGCITLFSGLPAEIKVGVRFRSRGEDHRMDLQEAVDVINNLKKEGLSFGDILG